MSKRYKTVEQWIAETISDTKEHPDSGKDGPCTSIALLYVQPTGGTKELDSVKLAGKTWKAKDVADRLKGKAETYAQDLGGIQTFQLQAFFGYREPQSFHPFKVIEGEISTGGPDRAIREDPTATGLVAQSMRHLERTQETLLSMAQGFVVRAAEAEQRARERETRAVEELNDATLIIREMIMQRRKEVFDMEMERLRFQRDTANQAQMMQQVPPLVNVIAGQEVFPLSVADKALVDQLCERVKPEQVDGMVAMGVITAEMSGPLKHRIAQYREEQAKKVEALRSLPAAAGIDGESNIVPIKKTGTGGQNSPPANT